MSRLEQIVSKLEEYRRDRFFVDDIPDFSDEVIYLLEQVERYRSALKFYAENGQDHGSNARHALDLS